MTNIQIISPETLFAVRVWMAANLSQGGGHFMTDEMLRYGLFVPDNTAFAVSLQICLN